MHTKSIIEVLFPDNFHQYLTKIKNKIKQLLAKLSMNKFEYFFEKAYKIKAAAAYWDY